MIKKTPKVKKKQQKKGSVEPQDADLWGHVMSGVEPLDERHKNRALNVENVPLSSGEGKNSVKTRKPAAQSPVANGHAPERRSSLPELTHGSQPGLDKSSAKKLKRGLHSIEGRIDLHGMTQEQAHRALNSFIDGSHGAKKRCVLVITGKGLKQDGSVGVLRSAVPRWLNEAPNRERVLAFSYATPKDGGEGALYVMLKRKR